MDMLNVQKYKKMKQYSLKNFTTNEQALERLQEIEAVLPEILNVQLEQWNSLKVVHDEPEVWRLWMQCGEVRINLHLIAPCSDPFFHFHPWPSVVKCVGGGYLHKTGCYPRSLSLFTDDFRMVDVEEMIEDIVPMISQVVPGSMYIMTDIRQCHQVIVSEGSVWNSSVMMTGKPYFTGASELLSRKKIGEKVELTEEEKILVINPIRKYYGLL